MTKKKCQIFTPEEYVQLLLEKTGYTEKVYGKKVLENSFGSGNVLEKIVDIYINDGLNSTKTAEQIKQSMEENIWGFEIDNEYIVKTRERLDKLSQKYGIYDVKWNLLQKDYLKTEISNKFSFIIGNPPYIKYHDLEKEDRIFLKDNFYSCKYGKFDYCYPFIEKSVSDLEINGKLGYIIPNSIFKNVFGSNLRTIIKPYLIDIIEFKNKRIFTDALTSSAMLILDKSDNIEKFGYFSAEDKKSTIISKEQLKDKWAFTKEIKSDRKNKFGDNYSVSNTIATQLNKAYVISDFIEVNEEFIKVNDYLIEKKLLHKTGSPKSLGKNKKEYLIFPYQYEDGLIIRYSEEQFSKEFPKGERYLNQFEKKLKLRDSDKNSRWFEYGRSQALSHMNKNKLLVSSVITNSIRVFSLDKKTIPYSGFYIISKKDSDLKEAERILTSDDFFDYIYNIGISASGKSFRITVKDILNYKY